MQVSAWIHDTWHNYTFAVLSIQYHYAEHHDTRRNGQLPESTSIVTYQKVDQYLKKSKSLPVACTIKVLRS